MSAHAASRALIGQRNAAPLLFVDIGSMSKPHDDHQQHAVRDGVADPVVADPASKTGPTPEGTRTRRARILGKQSDRTLDARANLRVDLAQGRTAAGRSLTRYVLTPSRGRF